MERAFSGLSSSEAKERLQDFGPNEIVNQKRRSVFKLLFKQFTDLLILILLVAVLFSFIMKEYVDASVILSIVLINAFIGFVQEKKAENTLDALKKLGALRARVWRDGGIIQIDASELVPGDIVSIEQGDQVPADLELLEIANLEVDEASLTGESHPVQKVLAEEKNTVNCFKGTSVVHGRGIGRVVKTGMQTELGQIAQLIEKNSAETPLQQRLRGFSKKLAFLIAVICVVLFFVGFFRGDEPFALFLLVVSLAVAAIPEALPAIITVSLSQGASRLSKKNALVKSLPAVESLGSVNYICTDKTGTLTQNQMVLTDRVEFPSEEIIGFPMGDLLVLLNNDVHRNNSDEYIGEATEIAMVRSIDSELFIRSRLQFERVDELPFDPSKRSMSTLHRVGDRFLLIIKGASEAIEKVLLEEKSRLRLQQVTNELAQQGKRTISFAYKWLNVPPALIESEQKGMELGGVCALMDPPRQEVKAVIETCRQAGIEIVMITGDHPLTARFIASELGILGNKEVITGHELNKWEPFDWENSIQHFSVFARVSPQQKLQILQAIQKRGNFVAMTGDGVNDAPSLEAADIGVAMGITGTDVSKEAADIVLLDDHFSTIVTAIEEGRRIFDNIRKFIKYILTCNAAEIWTIAVAPFLGLPNPLMPTHLLWINLVTDGLPAVALSNEKPEKNIMQIPPRQKKESLFDVDTIRHIVILSVIMAAVTLFSLTLSLNYFPENWRTIVFTTLAFAQLGHVLSVRSEGSFLFQQKLRDNALLILSVILTFLLQIVLIYSPYFNEAFQTSPLSLKELLLCIGMAAIVFHIAELDKWLRVQRNRQVSKNKS